MWRWVTLIEIKDMIKTAAKSIIPDKYLKRLRLLRQSYYNKKTARRFFSEIAKKSKPILTDDDLHIIAALPKEFNSILEVGSGGGRLTYWLVDSGYDVTAVEPHLWYRNKVGRFIKKNLPGRDFEIRDGNIHALEFKDNQFDVVVCGAVIEHIDEPKQGIEELVRVAKKCVVVTTPVGNSCPSPDHKHIFFMEDIKRLFDAYDFDVMIHKTGAKQQIETFVVRVNLS